MSEKLDEIRKEITNKKPAEGNTKQKQTPTTWAEAASSFLKEFEGKAERRERKYKSMENCARTVRRIEHFWPSIKTAIIRNLKPSDAAQFFGEAKTGTGRFTRPKGQSGEYDAAGFKNGKQTKGLYNIMLTYAQMIGYHAVELDEAKELPPFRNPFKGIQKDQTEDPEPVLPSTDDFYRILEEVRKPSDPEFAATLPNGEDFLNYAGIKFMSGSGFRIGEVIPMDNRHPDDEPHPGFRWYDLIETGDVHRFFCHSEKKRPHQEAKTRLVPYIEGMLEFMAEVKARLFKGDEKALVFEGIDTANGVNVALARACKKLKITPITQQDLRHYFITICVEAKIDYKTIAEWVGHDDGGMLIAEVYGHLRAKHSDEMAKQVTLGGYTVKPNEKPPGGVPNATVSAANDAAPVTINGVVYTREELHRLVALGNAALAVVTAKAA